MDNLKVLPSHLLELIERGELQMDDYLEHDGCEYLVTEDLDGRYCLAFDAEGIQYLWAGEPEDTWF